MADQPPREIRIPENNCTILVYSNGIAILSPEGSRIRSVWKEKTGEKRMHHVLEWDPVSDYEYLKNIGVRVTKIAKSD